MSRTKYEKNMCNEDTQEKPHGRKSKNFFFTKKIIHNLNTFDKIEWNTAHTQTENKVLRSIKHPFITVSFI